MLYEIWSRRATGATTADRLGWADFGFTMTHQFDRLFTTVGAAIAAHRKALEELGETERDTVGIAHLVALQALDEAGRPGYRVTATKLARRWAKAERLGSGSPKPDLPLDRAFVSSLACDLKHALPVSGRRSVNPLGDFKALAVLAAASQREALRGSEAQAAGRALLRVRFVHAAAVALARLLSEAQWQEAAEIELCDLMLELPPDAAKLAFLNSVAGVLRLPWSLAVHRAVTETYLGKPAALDAPLAVTSSNAAAIAHHLSFRRARLAGDEAQEVRAIAEVLDDLSRTAKPGAPIRAFFLPEIAERAAGLRRPDLERRALELALIGQRGGAGSASGRVRAVLTRIRSLCAPVVVPAGGRSPALVLVSQIQRSGGSLLSQLFDGHPNLLALPHELRLNEPKWEWPAIDLRGDPLAIFEGLMNDRYPLFIARGYSKADGNQAAEKDRRGFPLDYPRFVGGFVRRLELTPPSSRRAVLNAYFTSFAASWGDVDGHAAPELVTAFAPRLNMSARTCKLFFEDYPDGHFITIVRDPLSWFASARRHEAEYSEVRAAIDLWKLSTYASLELARAQPRRATVILYSDLVRNLDAAIALLCERIGIEDHPALRMPTFLGEPILSNSSFQASEYGVRTEGLSRWRGELPPAELDYVTAEAVPIYRDVEANYSLSRTPLA